MGTLFGIVFLSHQVGAFAGVWLGGVIESATGSYEAMWWLSVALGLFAAAIHLPISERHAPPLEPRVADGMTRRGRRDARARAWSWPHSAASGSCGTSSPRRPPLRGADPTPGRCWSARSAAVPSSYGVATRVLLWMRRPIRCTTTEAASAARPIAMVIGSR